MIRAVDALSCYRLTRLVVADDLTAPIREKVIRWAYSRTGVDLDVPDVTQHAQNDRNAPRLAQLWSCRYCASVWTGAGVVLARRFAPKAWEPVAMVLSLSSLAALISTLED